MGREKENIKQEKEKANRKTKKKTKEYETRPTKDSPIHEPRLIGVPYQLRTENRPLTQSPQTL